MTEICRKPKVTVIAGPNGAGKTSIQSLLKQAHLVNCNVVNIDALQIDEDSLPEDPLRYPVEIAKRTDRKFRLLCEDAISMKYDFAFECNLRADQVKYLGLFEDAGYEINLVYVWLNNVEISYRRVADRVSKGGHLVGKQSILANYKDGLANLDGYFDSWDNIHIIDNSLDFGSNEKYSDELSLIIYVHKGRAIFVSKSIENDVLLRDFPNIISSYNRSLL